MTAFSSYWSPWANARMAGKSSRRTPLIQWGGSWPRGMVIISAKPRTWPVAASSRTEALESAEAGGRVEAQVTTQAARIADLVAKEKQGEQVTVYATYASLERIVAAHQDFALPAWDLVIIDEAHRTAGSEGKAWAAIHADDKVPAARRLYFTVTRKIADDRHAKAGLTDLTEGQELPALCSIDRPHLDTATGHRARLSRRLPGAGACCHGRGPARTAQPARRRRPALPALQRGTAPLGPADLGAARGRRP
ncbi:DEAD/DEAH box helicase family protein [Kitasatospora sp. NPDC057015]|uniref:DEAD/DEAH box helicase family protein n=1 Tax=Kitasatospora sp. NPDC057015 TaxID=3346001 RepID=UPI0036452C75